MKFGQPSSQAMHQEVFSTASRKKRFLFSTPAVDNPVHSLRTDFVSRIPVWIFALLVKN
jgi:hypothetical protein